MNKDRFRGAGPLHGLAKEVGVHFRNLTERCDDNILEVASQLTLQCLFEVLREDDKVVIGKYYPKISLTELIPNIANLWMIIRCTCEVKA